MRHMKNKQIVWDAIRAVHSQLSAFHQQVCAFTVADLEDWVWQDKKLRLNGKIYKRYLKGLTAYGCLERVVDGALIAGRWKLVRDEGNTAPYVNEDGEVIAYGDVRRQIWQTIRILRKFNTRDLRINATTEECPITQNNANQYVSWLIKAGVLARVGKRGHLERQTLQLVPSKNTGPRPPMIEKLVRVRDGNNGTVLFEEGGADE